MLCFGNRRTIKIQFVKSSYVAQKGVLNCTPRAKDIFIQRVRGWRVVYWGLLKWKFNKIYLRVLAQLQFDPWMVLSVSFLRHHYSVK